MKPMNAEQERQAHIDLHQALRHGSRALYAMYSREQRILQPFEGTLEQAEAVARERTVAEAEARERSGKEPAVGEGWSVIEYRFVAGFIEGPDGDIQTAYHVIHKKPEKIRSFGAGQEESGF
jgi:hypothetical protein